MIHAWLGFRAACGMSASDLRRSSTARCGGWSVTVFSIPVQIEICALPPMNQNRFMDGHPSALWTLDAKLLYKNQKGRGSKSQALKIFDRFAIVGPEQVRPAPERGSSAAEPAARASWALVTVAFYHPWLSPSSFSSLTERYWRPGQAAQPAFGCLPLPSSQAQMALWQRPFWTSTSALRMSFLSSPRWPANCSASWRSVPRPQAGWPEHRQRTPSQAARPHFR